MPKLYKQLNWQNSEIDKFSLKKKNASFSSSFLTSKDTSYVVQSHTNPLTFKNSPFLPSSLPELIKPPLDLSNSAIILASHRHMHFPVGKSSVPFALSARFDVVETARTRNNTPFTLDTSPSLGWEVVAIWRAAPRTQLCISGGTSASRGRHFHFTSSSASSTYLCVGRTGSIMRRFHRRSDGN